MRRIGLILLLGAICALVDGNIRRIALSVPDAPTSGRGAESSPSAPREEAAIVFDWFRQPGVVFIDASAPAEFRAGRIPGAWNIPPDEFKGGEIPAVLASISPSAAVVVYCRSDGCDAAEFVTLRLSELGYGDVRLFRRGFRAWTAAGYPTQAGP